MHRAVPQALKISKPKTCSTPWLGWLLLSGMIRLIVISLVNRQVPSPYMDEVFHVNQTRQYCNGNYSEWDDSITTFPGMYVIIAWMANLVNTACEMTGICILDACSVSNLRIINGLLFGSVLDFSVWNLAPTIGSFASVVSMPIIAFYSILYYTDTAATGTVFAAMALFKTGHIAQSGLVGLVAVAIRQTNIAWVFVMACGHLVSTALELDGSPDNQILKDRRRIGHALVQLRFHIIGGIGFSGFLYANDWSPVLGHREYHRFKAHFAQLNYFLLTALFVSGPSEWWRVIQKLKIQTIAGTRSFVLKFVLLTALFSACARLGTIAHQFILSDNRHLTFYLWRRVFKHPAVREILIPLISATAAILSSSLEAFRLTKNRIANSLLFWVAVLLVLVPTSLLEFRYFSIPLAIVSLNHDHLKWHLTVTTGLIGLFVFFPFQNAQTGTSDRFML